ncbi:hypothetical protein USDA257_p04150 (plasmid) [Sinorhizobium fredii USDA 257]|uniref:Uncharacterized protein n=1 Tax=Sinorhizobium fredii (strain USDA 257) TaxID=1185652 RepID=I3XGX4_SINF2|nr:hypothetical protein USDA257_p04150 [Sinorhizobium fredii USDA 257]
MTGGGDLFAGSVSEANSTRSAVGRLAQTTIFSLDDRSRK